MFAGGGTGGHLLPGVSLAEELRSGLGAQIRFLITRRKIDQILVPTGKFSVVQIRQESVPKRLTGIPVFLFFMLVAALRTLLEIIKFRPHLVVGLGGFGSFTAVVCGKLLCLPAVLLEQNAFPGKANRLLSHLADGVFCEWERTVRSFPFPRKVFPLGNPIRRSLTLKENATARISFGLSPHISTLLVLGGSQGAHALNIAMCRTAQIVNGQREEFQVIHLAGAPDREEVENAYRRNGVRARVVDFLFEMEQAYSAADLVFCRAGGTTIAELTALGLPAVLVPYPHSSENHQFANAEELRKNGAAVVLSQEDLSPLTIKERVLGLLADRRKLSELSRNAKSLGKIDASEKIARKVGSQFSLSRRLYPSSPLL
jgi:UDP-N-acetylglucosamine--N-acetylmuramyl-(pentapeptide) pyrophosphoryl-undecaprenol N-acetylglucosamine transferase